MLALECIQCDRQALWYSPEENERHIARCQKGLIPASRCTNATHTHCIYSYYRQGGVMTVTERRCGTAEEMTGCTLYKSMRARRHFVGGSGTDVQPMASSRRRETGPLVVEVCTGGCQKDGCVSGAAGGGRHCGFWTAFASVALLLLTTVAMGGGAGGGGAERWSKTTTTATMTATTAEPTEMEEDVKEVEEEEESSRMRRRMRTGGRMGDEMATAAEDGGG